MERPGEVARVWYESQGAHLSKAALEPTHGRCRRWRVEVQHFIVLLTVEEALGQEVLVLLPFPLVGTLRWLVLLSQVEMRHIEVDPGSRRDETVVNLRQSYCQKMRVAEQEVSGGCQSSEGAIPAMGRQGWYVACRRRYLGLLGGLCALGEAGLRNPHQF